MWTLFKRQAAKLVRLAKAPSPKDSLNDGYERFKRDHPDATFAQYYVWQAKQTIAEGNAHSTLGLKLYAQAGQTGEKDYFQAGRAAFDRYQRLFKLSPADKVVDYGCGSLRLGVHFIEFLAAGNYFGLDVTRDFMDIGMSAAPELIAQKKPQLLAIDDTSIGNAAEFGANAVISNAVSYHVHPEETDTYLDNLRRICVAPGARLFFDVKLSNSTARFRSRGWAYPLEMYIDGLKPLTFVKQHRVSAIGDYPAVPDMRSAVLEFRRN
jgi:SAM-dependent methyltransferase